MTLPRSAASCAPTIVGLSSRGRSFASGASSFSSSIPASRARIVSSSATVDISGSQLSVSRPHPPNRLSGTNRLYQSSRADVYPIYYSI
jgi:hypothetical protein